MHFKILCNQERIILMLKINRNLILIIFFRCVSEKIELWLVFLAQHKGVC